MLVVVSITETLSLSVFVTYTFVPSGVIATPKGLIPTGTVAETLFIVTSITETVLPGLLWEPECVTYAILPLGLSAIS